MGRSVDRTSATSATGTSAGSEVALSPGGAIAAFETGWPNFFAGSPREVLARLVQDDSFAVRARVAARLRADALLLDGDRVHLRALARISRSARSYRGRPGLSEWLDGIVVSSVEEVVREEQEWARSRSPSREGRVPVPEAPGADAYASLAGPLGLDPKAMRAACAAFDALPFTDRSAFFELVLEARELDGAAHAAGVSASEIARRARRGLDAVLVPLGAEADVEKGRKR